jgi:hypothetical protein
MMRLPVVLSLTAAKSPRPGDHATDFHPLLLGLVRLVHVIPSGLVMMHAVVELTLFAVPTATNSDSSGDQQTDCHVGVPAEEDARRVHVIPSGEVCTSLPVLVSDTATKSPRLGAQQTEFQCLTAA